MLVGFRKTSDWFFFVTLMAQINQTLSREVKNLPSWIEFESCFRYLVRAGKIASQPRRVQISF